jgi:hypothetical protein
MSIESNLPTMVEEMGDLPSTSLSSSSDEPLAISMGLTGRNGAMKDALLGAYGGNATTENAVDLGLQWLIRNQGRDGSWTLRGPYADGSTQANRLAATSMALIAFAGAGHTHRAGKYKEHVAKALKELLKWQDNDGSFSPDGRVPDQHMAYSHAQATIALCELYGMSRDYDLKKAAQLAVNYAQDWQDQEKGGWRYYPRTDSDLSVTGWYVMALISARMAGLSTDEQVLKKANKFLDTVAGDNGSVYYYIDYAIPSNVESITVDLPMTAEGLLCRMYLGWTPSDPKVRRGANYLSQHPVSIDVSDRNYYYWYYATQTMHHLGDPMWSNWNNIMRETLPDLQVKTGKETGSWPPQGDPHGSIGGRLYSTCLSIYCLEVYYRHLPLYNAKSHRTLN